MKLRPMYSDTLRGPVRVRPVRIIESKQLRWGGHTGVCVVCRVAERKAAGYKIGELINVEPSRLVYLQSDQKCYQVPMADVIAAVEKDNEQCE